MPKIEKLEIQFRQPKKPEEEKKGTPWGKKITALGLAVAGLFGAGKIILEKYGVLRLEEKQQREKSEKKRHWKKYCFWVPALYLILLYKVWRIKKK